MDSLRLKWLAAEESPFFCWGSHKGEKPAVAELRAELASLLLRSLLSFVRFILGRVCLNATSKTKRGDRNLAFGERQ